MADFEQSPLISTLRYRTRGAEKPEQEEICTQLMLGLKEYYCHLPQKMSAFGFDPIQQLDTLRNSDGRGFTRSMLRIINRLRDRHTTLRLAEPWTHMVAYVPFIIEQYFNERGWAEYVVSKHLFGFDEIPIGARVTHWNGVPIHIYLREFGRQSQGANASAQMRLAISYLSIRSMAYVPMPNEDWVTLTYYDPSGALKTSSTPWRFYINQPSPTQGGGAGADAGEASGDAALHIGLDEQTLTSNKFKSLAQNVEASAKLAETTSEGALRYGKVETPTGPCGYLRIFSFDVGNVDSFISRMAKILADLPQERLIIDLRENPGGMIPAGQKLIRLLSPKERLEAAPISFRSTRSTQKLAALRGFEAWQKSLELQGATANLWSQSFPIVPYYQGIPDYRYPGKVTLIIDSLCYSTTDFFAADFRDNGLGKIIGIDAATGGGGANVWPWNTLVRFANYAGDAAPKALPVGYSLNLSLRRAYRTGSSRGLPIEDLGVPADTRYKMTRRDLLEENTDLIDFTAAQMA
ncbi:MAG: S41 family peptidase [Pseudomonadota bacterium]